MKLHLAPLFLVALFSGAGLAAGSDPITPDLNAVAQSAVRWEADAKGRPALFTSRVLWLDDVTFAAGEIECDILGHSNPRGSNFPGIAFHGENAATFECVYFRPFNFRAENPENAAHAVQYTSEPQWPWAKLRAEKTGQYEKPIAPSLDGDAWFHVRIVVTEKAVSVFVNGAAKPSLEVVRLTDRVTGKIAIWGGDAGEGGYFANLKITPARP